MGGGGGEYYDSINYVYNFGHDIEVMHAINVKHIRQIRTIEDAKRTNAIEKHFKEQTSKGANAEEDESAITVIPIEKEIDIVL